MEITSELLGQARKYRRPAVEAILTAYYPEVHRMACALTGRPDAARNVIRFVMHRSLRVMPRWMQQSVPERWFHHHTVLASRRAVRQQPDPADDLLVRHADLDEPGYIAFVRALRRLPVQQKEAFVLHHGEKWNERYMGIAMDCSREAAEQHLRAASDDLSAVSGEAMERYAAEMARAYGRLNPPAEAALPAVRPFIRRVLWPRRLRRLVLLLLFLAAVAAGGWLAWRWFG